MFFSEATMCIIYNKTLKLFDNITLICLDLIDYYVLWHPNKNTLMLILNLLCVIPGFKALMNTIINTFVHSLWQKYAAMTVIYILFVKVLLIQKQNVTQSIWKLECLMSMNNEFAFFSKLYSIEKINYFFPFVRKRPSKQSIAFFFYSASV